jgi:hypothetical protein
LLLNLKWKHASAYGLAMATAGDTLEVFFERALTESKLILLSLHSGRVYVGKIEDNSKPLTGRRHIKILPFMSGFRWPLDTKPDGAAVAPNRIHWSTTYAPVVRAILSNTQRGGGAQKQPVLVKVPGPTGALVDVDASEMGIVVCVDDIETATIFNQRMYAYLNRDRYPPILDRLTPKKASAGQLPADMAAVKVAEAPR